MPHPLRLALLFLALAATGCTPDEPMTLPGGGDDNPTESALSAVFGDRIDPEAPLNYADQDRPAYVTRDNTAENELTDLGATLGRVLFYDRNLSANGTVSCASCHRQGLAFGDDALASEGVAGTTARHSMRLTNARFGDETRFFWDERAVTLEAQATQPIRDHVEMGFSGADGDPPFANLLSRLTMTAYYPELFTAAFGDPAISEERIQQALAQFIRSMESFDAKYDVGRAQVDNDGTPFPNFTAAENRGKTLFLRPPTFAGAERVGGGLGCGSCHQAPEFSIGLLSRNNGVTGTFEGGQDQTITRAPSLRDVFLPDGTDNGPFMHNGQFATLDAVLSHYNEIPGRNPGLDPRLAPGGQPQRLNITAQERQELLAFLRTLTGSGLYEDERWGDPFLE